ncbi:MAG: TRAP transporter large permease subunit, partial [Alphaproteobacteria bacterium]|nr:TRAP transporter large permease subunit [Alphaproteobacteria bacterium]
MELNFLQIFLSTIFLVALVILRIPIGYVMILLGIAGVGLVDGMDILHFQLRDLAISQFSNYDLSVIPMFILVGIIVQNIGYGEKLFKAFNKIFRTIPGGLAIATIFTAAGIGSISGSSVATTSTLCEISIR